jgi:hypothetical protein
MMFIEFNKNSSLPIIRDLNEGCSSSDAWLLLGRLNIFLQKGHVWYGNHFMTLHSAFAKKKNSFRWALHFFVFVV